MILSIAIEIHHTSYCQIMEKILMQLHDHGILGLPVHDSEIVEKQHHDLLYQVMMEEYGWMVRMMIYWKKISSIEMVSMIFHGCEYLPFG